MSSINGGMWRGAQNTKIPAISHVLSYRVSGIVNTAGTAVQTFVLPQTASNPAQITPAQNAVNYAPQASPVLPSNEPQQGLRLFVTQMVVRDANGILFGTGTGNNTTVALIDQNYTAAGVYTPTVNNNAAGAGNTVLAVSNTVVIPAAVAGGAAPYVQAQIGVSNGTQGGAAADATGIVVINPYDQLAITVLVPAAGGTAATATGCTVDIFGYWAQTI